MTQQRELPSALFTHPLFLWDGLLPSLGSYLAETGQQQKPYSIENGDAVFHLNGVLFKETYEGWYKTIKGTAQISNELRQAAIDPTVKRVILRINSGGGAANAVKPMADAIKFALSLGMEVICYADDLLASAAYFIASYCSKIYVSTEFARVGSIGTMINLTDQSAALEKWGYKIHEIYATTSTHKNKDYREAMEGNYDPIREKLLNPLNEYFTSEVKGNRSALANTKNKTVMAGDIFLGAPALEIGLVDGIKDYSGPEEVTENENSNTANMKINAKGALASFLGLQSTLEVKTELSQEQWNEIEAKLEDHSNLTMQVSQLTEEKQTLADQLAAANQSVQELQGTVGSLQAEVATLKESPDNGGTQIENDTDPEAGSSQEEPVLKSWEVKAQRLAGKRK